MVELKQYISKDWSIYSKSKFSLNNDKDMAAINKSKICNYDEEANSKSHVPINSIIG